MNRLGIYVQVPFCQTKCTYCNFHTGVVSSARFAPYVACVCGEIAGYRALYEAGGIALPASLADAVVDTIYIGAGHRVCLTGASATDCAFGSGEFCLRVDGSYFGGGSGDGY